MCALAGGRSVESTMGFTALDGLPMGTRSGQIDPGVLLYLMTEKGMSAAALEDLLYRESGLKGLSGISNDMRELEASEARPPRLRSTISFTASPFMPECSRPRSAGLMRLSSLPVSGKNRPAIRARVAEKLAWLGVDFDPAANASGNSRISRPHSGAALYVIPTDEELMIAKHTLALIAA